MKYLLEANITAIIFGKPNISATIISTANYCVREIFVKQILVLQIIAQLLFGGIIIARSNYLCNKYWGKAPILCADNTGLRPVLLREIRKELRPVALIFSYRIGAYGPILKCKALGLRPNASSWNLMMKA